MSKKQKVRSRLKLFLTIILITMLTLTGFTYFNRSAEANAVGVEATLNNLALLDSSLADIDDAIEDVNSGIAIGNIDMIEQGIFQVKQK